MVFRGERIGDAYIRIHADGSGFDRDIRRDFKDFDPVMRSLGEEHAQSYHEAFDNELERRGEPKAWIKIARDMNESIGRFDAGSEWIEKWDDRLDALREKIEDEFGDQFGDRFSARIREAMQKGFIQTQEDFDNFTSDLRPHIVSITQEIDNENGRLLAKMLRDQEKYLRDLEKDEADSSADILDIRRKENLSIIEQFKDRIAEHARAVDLQERKEKEAADKERALTQAVSDFRNRMWKQRIKENETEFKRLEETFERLSRGATKFGGEVEETQRDLQRYTESTADLRRENERTTEGVGRLRSAFGKIIPRLATVKKDNDDTTDALRRMRIGLALLTPRLDRVNHRWGEFADVLGRATGHGSRNNFIHFVGSVNRNLALLTRGIFLGPVRGFQKLLNIFDEVRQGAFKLSDFKDIATNLSKTAAGGIASLTGIAALIALIGTVAGVATAAVSGLVAVLVALASSVLVGAAGAIGALAGALVPLGAAIGTIVLGYKSLSAKRINALRKELKPLADGFKELKKAVGDVLFQDVGKWARELAPALKAIQPVAVEVAEAIRDTITNAIEQARTSPALKRFAEDFGVFIPRSVRRLGSITTNVMIAITGLFHALIPITREFLGWMDRITASFAEWTSSRKGQKELREFFRGAADSAKAVGDFLAEAVKFVAQLIAQSKETGDELFRNMADAIHEAVDWLASPEGQQAMQDWMDFAKDFGEALGHLIEGVITLIDHLDTPETREFATKLIEGLTNVLDVLAKVIDFAIKSGQMFGPLFAAGKQVVGVFKDVKNFLDFGGSAKQVPFVKTAIDAVQPTIDWKNAVDDLKDSLDEVTGAATAATRVLALQELQTNGLTTTANKLGISQRTLVSAALGNKRAMSEVNKAVVNADDNFGGLNSTYAEFLQKLGISSASLRRERNEIQKNSQAVTNYHGKLKGLPQKVKTLINTEGIKPSITGIANVIRRAKELAPNLKPRQIKTIIEASGVEPTIGKIKKVLTRVKELNKNHADIPLSIDTDPFNKDRAKIHHDVDTLTRTPIRPKADIEDKAFNARAKHVQEQLRILDSTKVSPGVSLSLEQYFQDRANLLHSLSTIPDEHVNIITNRIGGGGDNGGTNSNSGNTGGSTGNQRSITVPSISIVTPAEDPRAVAQELLNRIVAQGY